MKRRFTSLRGKFFSRSLALIIPWLLLASASQLSAQVSSAACNTFSPVVNPTFGNLTVTSSQGLFGGDEFSNKGNVIDNNTTNAATYSFLLAGSAWLEVKDNAATGSNVYPGGSFAGFAVNDNSLLSAFGSVAVTTYLGNTQQENVTSGSLLSTGILSGVSRVGFYTASNKPFDRIRITFSALGAGSVSVYYAVVEKFCNTSPTLACNTPTSLTAPANSVYINTAATGVGGVCALCGVNNADNVIDGDPTNSASIVLTAGLAASGTIAVKNALVTYPANTFIGFDISRSLLANIGLLDGISVSTYITGNPNPVQTFSGASLLSANSSIISGSGRQTIGFLATQSFDEARLTVMQGVGVSLGSTNVFGLVAQRFCSGPSLLCSDNTIPSNTLTPLTYPTSPVYVDGANSGVDGLLCAGCSLNNSNNVIDSDPSNFASIVLAAGIATNGSIAVANPVDTYPANSFAGFDVESASLLSAGVLSSATVSLLNNGTVVQTSSGNGLIVGATSNLLTGRTRQIVGIVANVPYDEVKISFTQLVGADLGSINIYGAIFQKSCTKTIACGTSYLLNSPDFPVVINSARTGVTGVAAAAVTVRDPWNVVSASTTDFATITNGASTLTSASISVIDPVDTYPVGTFAGYAIRKVSGLITANLFSAVTITTYLNGVQQESKSAGNLIDLTLLGVSTNNYNVGFVSTKTFNEVQITVSSLAGISVLGGKIDVFGAVVDTRTSAGGSLFCTSVLNPDFTVSNTNTPVSGNLKTNDVVQAGTTYGPAPAPSSQPSGSSPTLTVNSDGTYTFSSSTPGVYVYAIPVCAPGQTTGCPTSTLTITVLDPTVTNNKPVANPDIVTTTGAPSSPTAITVNVRANDGPGNAGGTLGTPTIPTQPAHGTASIDGSGNLVYTPTAGYYGTDVVTYQVCETPGNLCSTATVTVTVQAPGSTATVSANDDYISTGANTPASGNVLTNDLGSGLTVSNPGTTVSSSGTLIVTSTGSYTFTPAAGVTGPASFTYTACDNSTPSVCGTATLHTLTTAVATSVINPDFNVTTNNVPATGNVSTNDQVPAGTTYGTPVPAGGNPSGAIITMNPNGTYSFTATTPGSYTYSVPVCAPGQTTGCPTSVLTFLVQDPASTSNKPVINPDYATTTQNTPVTINVRANDGPGNTGGTLGTPTLVGTSANGTATVNGSGNIVYTPNAGFVGDDIVTYQVCETPSGLCQTAQIVVHVTPTGSNTTTIVDDYVSAPQNTSATGNVLTNDLGSGLTVSNPGTTVTSSGTLVITSTGSYTFTPATGVSGPASFTYTACDNSTPSVCGTATLHVLVAAGVPDLTPIIRLPLGNFTASGANATRNFTVELTELNGQRTSSGNVVFTITAPLGFTLAFDNSQTSINVSGGTTNPVIVDNPNWTVSAVSSIQLTLTIKPGLFIPANGVAKIGFTITRAGSNSGNTSNMTVNVSDDASRTYDSNPANNIYVRNINSL
jgi:hypothetical protein